MKSKLPILLALALCVVTVPALADGHLNIVLEADLDGNDEVRTGATNNSIVGDPNGEGEVYVFGVEDPLTLCYVLEAEAIAELDMEPGGGRAAHIHEAPAGVNGGIRVHLAFPTGGAAANCVTEGDPDIFPTGEAGIVQRILANPADFYVNVHNSVYPAGAIRGQLSNSEDDD
jgi:hypothetical protein